MSIARSRIHAPAGGALGSSWLWQHKLRVIMTLLQLQLQLCFFAPLLPVPYTMMIMDEQVACMPSCQSRWLERKAGVVAQLHLNRRWVTFKKNPCHIVHIVHQRPEEISFVDV